ncbi:RES family NAD+ phosphorylase [Ruegeria sp. R14_0]|uniref:RES family NAD+ phosphorylase n=1 Tax=Ruegeria sp. R14_0 TaxID=2821100 RepID=UPI001ADA68D8|nr:RES family NAD+ phosphorylase [Ruegeria sp. R14_0]MBO9447154.1 RES family NAD+ phosphorylase [Ruegeria sp. R14_0]
MLDFSGPVWRILFQSQLDTPLAPARAPEGRFHYAGQTALYASLSAEGAGVAIRRYVSAGDPLRVLLQVAVTGAKLVDLRGQPDASVIWQDTHAATGTSPTWRFSDHARDAGADGLLYSSRTRPELSHIVLFDPSPSLIRADASPVEWTPPYPQPPLDR